MNESTYERVLDARIMRRLRTDRAYLHAANAEEQKYREDEIEVEEAVRLQREFEQHRR